MNPETTQVLFFMSLFIIPLGVLFFAFLEKTVRIHQENDYLRKVFGEDVVNWALESFEPKSSWELTVEKYESYNLRIRSIIFVLKQKIPFIKDERWER